MDLMLVDDVPGLGRRGEMVTVARGYARNFLIPKGLACVPSEHAVKEVRATAAKREAEFQEAKTGQMEVAKALAQLSLTIPMKAGKEGHLYGSVGPRQIVDALAEAGHAVDEKLVQLEPHLKDLGEYDVSIALHPEVLVPVKVAIVDDEVQAE